MSDYVWNRQPTTIWKQQVTPSVKKDKFTLYTYTLFWKIVSSTDRVAKERCHCTDIGRGYQIDIRGSETKTHTGRN